MQYRKFILNSIGFLGAGVLLSFFSILKLYSSQGSFLGGTYVNMADGSLQAIETIRPGDRVLCYDIEKSELADGIVIERLVYENKGNQYLNVNGKANVTKNHLFYVQGQWVSAGSLQKGNMLLNNSFTEEEFASATKIKSPEPLTFYDLKVEKYSNYFAAGFLVKGARLKRVEERYIPTE